MTEQARARHGLTTAAIAPVALAVVMVNLLWPSGNSWFLLFAGGAVGVLVLGVAARARINDLALGIQHPPRVAVGQELVDVVLVANGGRRMSSPVLLLLRTRGLSDVTVYVGPLRPGELAGIETRRLAVQRGIAEHMTVEMVSRPSLGLIKATLHRTVKAHLIVHPERVEPRDDATTRRRADDVAAEVVPGPGTDLLGLREWRRGDDQRHVHWRSTARHDRLVVIERGETALPAVRLLLVGPAAAQGFERALALSAGTCDRALRGGRPVAVAAWLASGLSMAPSADRLELLDWWSSLTDVVLPDPAGFAVAAASAFGRGELIVAGPPGPMSAWFPAAASACRDLRLHQLGDAA